MLRVPCSYGEPLVSGKKGHARQIGIGFAALCAFGLSAWGCQSSVVERIRETYVIGSEVADLGLDPQRILLDLQHPSERDVPLIVGMRGYSTPERSLSAGERLLVVTEELDFVSYLYFCADRRLCAVEVLGS